MAPGRWLAGDGRHPRRDKRCYPTISFAPDHQIKTTFCKNARFMLFHPNMHISSIGKQIGVPGHVLPGQRISEGDLQTLERNLQSKISNKMSRNSFLKFIPNHRSLPLLLCFFLRTRVYGVFRQKWSLRTAITFFQFCSHVYLGNTWILLNGFKGLWSDSEDSKTSILLFRKNRKYISSY